MSVISADLHNVLSLGAPMTLFSGMIIAGLRYPSAKFDFLKSPERGLVKFQRKNLRMARVSDHLYPKHLSMCLSMYLHVHIYICKYVFFNEYQECSILRELFNEVIMITACTFLSTLHLK